jgi:predicted dinucleotide-binding enzyme
LQPNLQGLELGNITSAGEKVAAWAPGAKVVKAFNTVGFNIMENPAFGSDKAVMFYCGDDPGAKETVRQLTEELGFDAWTLVRLSKPVFSSLLRCCGSRWRTAAVTGGKSRSSC